MKIRACVVLVTLAALLVSAASRTDAATILAPTVTVNVGDLFTLSISISDAIDVTSWQFDLAFTPAVLRAESMTEGPFLASFGPTLFTPPLIVDNTLGMISGSADFFLGVPPLPSGAGVLATIAFTALAPGVSPLVLSNVFLNLSSAGFDNTPGEVTLVGQPPTIPEPATFTLLLGGLVALRRRLRGVARRAASVSVVLVSVTCGIATPCSADTINVLGAFYTISAGTGTTAFEQDRFFTAPRFDSSLGTLDSIHLTVVRGAVGVSVTVDSESPFFAAVFKDDVVALANTRVRYVGGTLAESQPVVELGPSPGIFLPPDSDGVPDFLGGDVLTFSGAIGVDTISESSPTP